MTPRESCEIEITRFFKKYYTFTSSSDSDDLNNLLNSLCSSIEKYEIATGVNVSKDNRRYLALKTLRNFSLHNSELLNTSKGIKASDVGNVRADVNLLCLLPVSVVERIINNTKQEQTKAFIREVFVFYENYVDIYPAIFNFAVDIYFLVKKCSLTISGEGYMEMVESINFEKTNNYSHYISGKIITLTDISVNDYINNYIISMDAKIKEDEVFLPRAFRLAKLESTPLEQFNTLNNKDKQFIYDDLILTKAIEIHESPMGRYFTVNRPLTPIEFLVVQKLIKRK